MEGARTADFFISYTQADIDKANRIAVWLEAIGYTTIAHLLLAAAAEIFQLGVVKWG